MKKHPNFLFFENSPPQSFPWKQKSDPYYSPILNSRIEIHCSPLPLTPVTIRIFYIEGKEVLNFLTWKRGSNCFHQKIWWKNKVATILSIHKCNFSLFISGISIVSDFAFNEKRGYELFKAKVSRNTKGVLCNRSRSYSDLIPEG